MNEQKANGLDALMERWERRLRLYEEQRQPSDHIVHFKQELRQCLYELRACTESASHEA